MGMNGNQARVSFLFVELEMGLSFVNAARITNDAMHAERSLGIARRACETVDLFRKDVELTPVEVMQLDLMRRQLGAELEGMVGSLLAS